MQESGVGRPHALHVGASDGHTICNNVIKCKNQVLEGRMLPGLLNMFDYKRNYPLVGPSSTICNNVISGKLDWVGPVDN